jgi:hypothetical protein
MFDAAAAGDARDPTDSPRAQFFNPLKTDTSADAKEETISWTAFPRTLLVTSSIDRDRWEKADSSRQVQDEYCEWLVERNTQGKIVRVTFTTEVPEYWETLADDSQDRLLALYRELVGPQVQLSELLDGGGQYNPRNRWNADGKGSIVHLIQGSNTVAAAVELAAAATIERVIDGQALTSEQKLIKCSGYGIPTRNSDPHIGASINALARMRADVTLADPPGLYINDDFTPAGWKTPDGTSPKAFWRWVRGEPRRRLRGVYEVPVEKGYVVGDISISGQPIEFGGQIADFVSIKIVGLACRIGASIGQPFTVCKGGG